jgi:glycosyltransferase involved in cell wall biosynthesis
VVGSRVGALPELVDEDGLVPPGDAAALADAMRRLAPDTAAGRRARERVRGVCAPEVVARHLAALYDGAPARAATDGQPHV